MDLTRYVERKLRELRAGDRWYERDPGRGKGRQSPRMVLRLQEYVREFPHEPKPTGVPSAIVLERRSGERIPLNADPEMKVWVPA